MEKRPKIFEFCVKAWSILKENSFLVIGELVLEMKLLAPVTESPGRFGGGI
jgi:hypothetical protein